MYTVRGACCLTWVHDRIYAAGGEHIPETWGSFVDQTGISAVVQMGSEKIDFCQPPPRALLWLKIEHERDAGIDECWLAARFIDRCLEEGRKVLLHCNSGRHRVRWLLVSYMIYSGRGVRGTLRRVADPPWLSPYKTNRELWEEFFQQVRLMKEARRV